MSACEILLDASGNAISPDEISDKIKAFGDSYNDAVKYVINGSKVLDTDGVEFIKCATRILKNFKMTRSGPFHMNLARLYPILMVQGV